MSWVTIQMDPEDNKAKIDWIYLRKIILDLIQGDQFLYILLEVGYNYSFNYYSTSFLIYTTSPLSSLPSTWTTDCLC